jgi:hypothetical protein
MDLHHDHLAECAMHVQPKAYAFLTRAEARGFRLLIVRAWASLAQQMEIYKIGRRYEAGQWVVQDERLIRTRAKPGESPHNVVTTADRPAAMAFDCIPLDDHDRPLWLMEGETPVLLDNRWVKGTGLIERVAWQTLYTMAGQCGLDPYGDPWGAYLSGDKGHFEQPGWKYELSVLQMRLPTIQETPDA